MLGGPAVFAARALFLREKPLLNLSFGGIDNRSVSVNWRLPRNGGNQLNVKVRLCCHDEPPFVCLYVKASPVPDGRSCHQRSTCTRDSSYRAFGVFCSDG